MASCVVHESRLQYIHRSTRIQGRREEIGPGTYVCMVGLLKMMIQQQYVRGIQGGLAITAADVEVVPPCCPPVLVCTWHMIR